MRTPYAASDQQWAAISAPLEPAVVIAGAGSGKTTLMAARVVYLVVTGQVRPDEVLGLTFTTKAASELRQRIRDGARAPPARSRRPTRTGEDVLEPTVATYNAYAAGLLTDHGLRIGHEPDTRVITDAARYQLGARAVDRFTGEVRHLTDHPATAIQNLLALDSAMSEHLVAPRRRARARRRRPRRLRAGAGRGGRRQEPHHLPRGRREGDLRDRPARRAARPGRGLPPAQARPRADGLLRPDRARRPAGQRAARRRRAGARRGSRWCCSTSTRTPRSPRPTMLSRLFGERPRGHRGRRPQPGDLRLARCVGLQHPQLRRHLPGRGRRPVPTYPLTVNRRSDARILEVANRLAAPLYDEVRPGRAAGRQARGRRSAPSRLGSSRRTPTSSTWLVERGAGRPTTDVAGPRSACSPATTPTPRTSSTPSPAPASRSRSSASPGCSGCPRSPRSSRPCTCCTTSPPTPSLLTLLTGPRWAIGPRDLRLLSRRAHEIAGRQGRGADAGVDHRPPARDRRRHRPGRDPLARRRARRPGRGAVLRRGAGAVRPARRRAADAAHVRRRAAARHRPPDHRHQRHRRRARLRGQPGGAAPAATTSTSS